MKRVLFLCSLSLFCLIGGGDVGRTEVHPAYGVAFGQSGAMKTCAFSIIGVWRVEGRTRAAKNFFYDFESNGAITVREYTADVLPQEYEVIGGATYALDNPDAPGRVEFVSIAMDKRGAIPMGKTSLLVVEYGDDSFVTADPKTQALTRWLRAQTRRCFLTFAARGAPSPSAFAMWTMLDGRETKIEALGLRTQDREGATPIFGAIPDRLYREFESESEKVSDAMLRLELSEAEFERSHRVFEAWTELARSAKLPYADPYLNGLEFLKSVAVNLNQCEERIKLDTTGGGAVAQEPGRQALEYVKALRKKNKSLHVTDAMFPLDWRPTLLPNG